MKTDALLLSCLLTLSSACATVSPRALSLPGRDAPLEERVVAYRAHAAMLHAGFMGWQMRIGRGNLRSIDEARPVLANAREAEALLHARDNQTALGWTIFGVGTAVMFSSLFTIPSALDASGGSGSLSPFYLLLGVGTAIALPSAFIVGAAERRVSPAAEAYNDWLWNELDLPRSAPTGRPLTTPHPAPSPWAPTP